MNSIEFGAIPTEKRWNTMKSNGKRLKLAWFRWNLLEILWKQHVSIEIQAYACVCTRYTRFFDRTRSSEPFDENKKSDNRTHERLHTREPSFRIENQFRGSVGLLFQKWRLKFRFAQIPRPTYTANVHDTMKQRRMAD